MEDGTTIDGEVSNDRTVEIAGNEASSKISELKERIIDLEKENGAIIREKKGYKQQIEELKSSIKDLSAENVDLKKQVNKVQSENKVSQDVVARAAELETEVSRLQHDLAAAMSDLKESSVELSDLKRGLQGLKVREKEKEVKLEAVEMEKALLVAKVEKLAGVESSLRDELEVKEKEIRGLKKNAEELEVVVGSSKNSEKLKNELEKTIEKMKAEISVLKSSLDEKEKVISGLKTKESAVLDGGVNGDAMVEGGKKGVNSGLKQREWIFVGGSTIVAVAVVGITCYIHAGKKH
ncbi:hypothetical protein Salat_2044700 [Sesamum alatum]|uniref:Uncharacterized protein n=1 Tax=Sesamum alatum TaxID=300844 RepID=A0AAE1Y0D0_9LAMI|nr:hypothetical protein Salat_2044700 [Sesamum alatum]